MLTHYIPLSWWSDTWEIWQISLQDDFDVVQGVQRMMHPPGLARSGVVTSGAWSYKGWLLYNTIIYIYTLILKNLQKRRILKKRGFLTKPEVFKFAILMAQRESSYFSIVAYKPQQTLGWETPLLPINHWMAWIAKITHHSRCRCLFSAHLGRCLLECYWIALAWESWEPFNFEKKAIIVLTVFF